MSHPSKYIRDIIARFLEKEASDFEINELLQWLEQNPLHRQYFDEVNEKFQTSSILNEFTPEKIDNAWQRLSSRLNEEKEIKISHAVITKGYYNFLRIAASVSILFVSGFLLWKFIPADIKEQPKNIVVNSPQGRNTKILLPDGSTVWLNANSTLEYASNFNAKREVKLSGEAFFDVKKKQGNQFIVKTEKLSIRVKGTRFNVRAYKGEESNTTLEEGKVELIIAGKTNAYAMTPGEQITVNNNEGKIIKKKVNPSNYSAWKEDVLVFENTPLADILAKLENRYKVKISLDENIAQRERLTMTIGQETFDEILEMIQLSSHLKYKKLDDNIIIYE
jgi:transmembrane sensor